MRSLYAFVLPFILCSAIARAQDAGGYDKEFFNAELGRYKAYFQRSASGVAADDRIDVTYYKLDLRVSASPHYLSGNVVVRAISMEDGLSAITLDLMNSLTVDSVKVGGSSVPFLQNPSSFNIVLDHSYSKGELLSVQVYYRGIPGSSGFGSFEFSSHSSTPWVWSLSEPYGAKDWWPCKDHPMDKADSADIIVTCDSAYKVGSNGRLLSVAHNGDGTATFHWQERYPISTYLISIAITNFAQFSNWFHYSPADSMEVLNYVLPENLASAQANLPLTVDMLQIYSNLFGLYPFVNEKYGHSQFGWGGGMEHQTMTSVGGFDESLVAHELAHQWFGDMITCRTWPDIWLNEGFATYCEVLYRERKYGTTAYWSDINAKASSAKGAVGTISVPDSLSNRLFSSSLVYNKGAWVLHMLRHVLGDSTFFHSMYNYANNASYKYNVASTRDFQSVCESTSGKDLDIFFNEWIFGERFPHYVYGATSTPTETGYLVTISLSQTTGTTNPSYFVMPIDFRITGVSLDTTVTFLNDQPAQAFSLSVPSKPSSVQLDPQGWILKDKDSTKAFMISRSSIDLGQTYLYNARTDSVFVTNGGLNPLIISSIVSNDPSFTVQPSTANIPQQQSQRFLVSFNPATAGSKSSKLYFTHNTNPIPDAINLAGRGLSRAYAVSPGWNLLSLPGMVPDPRVATLFTSARRPAWEYADSAYVPCDSLKSGTGYWLRFASGAIVPLDGGTCSADTLPVHEGWNLIGSISVPVSVSAVTSDPPNLITSRFFGYSSGYIGSDSLLPSRGYWIKARGDGAIILSSSSFSAKAGADQPDLAAWNTLSIGDQAGRNQALYFGEGEIGMPGLYEAPPRAPEGAFDVRFRSNRLLEVLQSGRTSDFPIEISSAEYPLQISWRLQNAALTAALVVDGTPVRLEGIGSRSIPGPPANLTLRLMQSRGLPQRFALEQNFPNPFNPATVIRYQLPVASRVTLKVYDLLGGEVNTLVDAIEDAGYRSTEWRPSENSSGIYFYSLTATSTVDPGHTFTQVRKMAFIK
jgi:peptidase M1-like protein/HYDIN/CFA65/VesB family protein